MLDKQTDIQKLRHAEFISASNLQAHVRKILKRVQDDRALGFTLAEVLITLGIIGVIAAITIPILINNSNEIKYKVAAKKAYSVCSNVVTQMKDEQGGTMDYYHQTEYSFKPVFMTYFKVMKDCGNTYADVSCVPETGSSSIYSSLMGGNADTGFLADGGEFTTTDGMFYGIYSASNRVMITVDVNGYEKKPNTFGVDVFMFELVGDSLLPGGAPNTLTNYWYYCSRSSAYSDNGLGCMAYVMTGQNY